MAIPGSVRLARVGLVVDREHYDGPVQALRHAVRSVWISTANLKDLHVEAPIGTRARARGAFISITEVLRELLARGVEVRVLHASAPSRPFRASLARGAAAVTQVLRQCPRVHMKVIVIDGESLYLGSANFTGAGIGARGDARRNFELGIITDDDVLLDRVQERFARIWSGKECAGCGLRRECPKPIDLLTRRPAAKVQPRPPAAKEPPRPPAAKVQPRARKER